MDIQRIRIQKRQPRDLGSYIDRSLDIVFTRVAAIHTVEMAERLLSKPSSLMHKRIVQLDGYFSIVIALKSI